MSTDLSETGTLGCFLTTPKEVPLDCIRVNPFQPRRFFSAQDLEELALSIQAVGLIHPPIGRPVEDGFYELISGERRFRAAQLLGMKSIPLLVRESDQIASAKAALIENLHRIDLNPIEISKALKNLIDECGIHLEALAAHVGKTRSTVNSYLKLLTLPKHIQESISAGIISMRHAKAILTLDGFEKQTLLHELILRDDLNVRETEEAALRISLKAKKQTLAYANRNFYLEQIADRLQQKLGTKVIIQGKGKKGRIFIDYYSLDDLDRLLTYLDP